MRLAKKYNQGGKPLTPFQKAFAKARDEGKETFMFEGKPYTTRTEQEEYSRYIQPGGPGSIESMLYGAEAEAQRKRDLEAYQNAMYWQSLATGAVKPMEGFNDPIFNILLGGRMLQKPAQQALKTALGPKYNPLNPQYNLNRGARGLGPENIYERLAGKVSRYGTRDYAPGAGPNPTVVNRIADFITENLPSFLRSQ